MSLQHYRGRRQRALRRATLWLAITVTFCQLTSTFALGQTISPARSAAKTAAKKDVAGGVDSKDTKIGQDWVRVKSDAKGQVMGMETAIVRYATAKSPGGAATSPVEVDLIGAVHIGDLAYYKQLNERFKQYDVLLYELVAPEGTVVERGRGTSNTHPVGAMQNLLKELLDLDHQLDDVDYTKPNFVHADMSPDEFRKAMEDRNETFLQMYFRLVGTAIAHQSEMAAAGGASDLELISALFADDRPRRLKIVLAKQLSEMESLLVSFGGENGSVIISDRNKKALDVLKKQLAQGKQKIGIFYGAGHLTDMDERLRKDFNLQPTSITWLTAWNLAAKK
jgi:hypothetical protein